MRILFKLLLVTLLVLPLGCKDYGSVQADDCSSSHKDISSLAYSVDCPLESNPSNAGHKDENNYLIVKDEYTLSYNDSKGEANWVKWTLTKSDLGNADRQNDFRIDKDLPKGFYKVSPSDYSHTGYDKGHLCPSGDRTDTAEHNSDTFLMTNMIPQTPANNRHTWESLEAYSRELALEGHTLTIIAGGAGSLGNLPGTHVNIPAYTWKIIKLEDGKVIAINVPNKKTLDTHWESYESTVKAIEKETGYSFGL